MTTDTDTTCEDCGEAIESCDCTCECWECGGSKSVLHHKGPDID